MRRDAEGVGGDGVLSFYVLVRRVEAFQLGQGLGRCIDGENRKPSVRFGSVPSVPRVQQ